MAEQNHARVRSIDVLRDLIHIIGSCDEYDVYAHVVENLFNMKGKRKRGVEKGKRNTRAAEVWRRSMRNSVSARKK
jgi:hypothetical protein